MPRTIKTLNREEIHLIFEFVANSVQNIDSNKSAITIVTVAGFSPRSSTVKVTADFAYAYMDEARTAGYSTLITKGAAVTKQSRGGAIIENSDGKIMAWIGIIVCENNPKIMFPQLSQHIAREAKRYIEHLIHDQT